MLEMQFLKTYLRPTESRTLGVESSDLCFNKFCGWFRCSLSLKNTGMVYSSFPSPLLLSWCRSSSTPQPEPLERPPKWSPASTVNPSGPFSTSLLAFLMKYLFHLVISGAFGFLEGPQVSLLYLLIHKEWAQAMGAVRPQSCWGHVEERVTIMGRNVRYSFLCSFSFFF